MNTFERGLAFNIRNLFFVVLVASTNSCRKPPFLHFLNSYIFWPFDKNLASTLRKSQVA